MHKLEIKLKQHTPLIHFQHDQEGATLRASEVKPKLDKYLLTALGRGNYQAGIAQARENGWLIGKGDHPALDYKIRIEAKAFKDVSIPVKPQKVRGVQQYDDFGRELYTTNSYPDNKASLIMSNIGGRVREEVFNMVIAKNVKMLFISKKERLIIEIQKHICRFIGRTSFGNRTSKGFGSFEVKEIDGEEVEAAFYSDDFSLSFAMLLDQDYRESEVYKDVFRVIHRIWKDMKNLVHVKGKNVSDVLLKISPQNTRQAERIPSPINFKPLVDISESEGQIYCDVVISMFYNTEVIKQVTGRGDSTYYKQCIANIKNNVGKNIFSYIDNIVTSKLESVNFEEV
jgi:hypothetical protein